MKPGKTGISRIFAATTYSIKGIKHSWRNEAAFRQESILACLLFPAAFFVGQSATEVALLILCLFIVLITELVNSAIEAIVDKTSPEIHPLAGAAKDCGSAAVCLSLIATVVIWGILTFANFT